MTLNFSDTVSMSVYILVFILDRSKWISTILTKDSAEESTPPPENRPMLVTTVDVRKILQRVNMNKGAGQDNLPGYVVKACADQPADVINDIFHILLSLSCA